MTIRRGEIIGKRVGEQPTDEAEHFIFCPACNGLMIVGTWAKCSNTRVRCRTPATIGRIDNGKEKE